MGDLLSVSASDGHQLDWYEDAGHGFNCDMRSSYHAPSAALAYERALAFLKKNLA